MPTKTRAVYCWQPVDSQTGRIVRTYAADKTRFARHAADRMDREYGAVRYVVRPLYEGTEPVR